MSPTGRFARTADGHIPSKWPDNSHFPLFFNDPAADARCRIEIRLSDFPFYEKYVIWFWNGPQ